MNTRQTIEWIAFMEKMHQCLSPEDAQKIQALAAERDALEIENHELKAKLMRANGVMQFNEGRHRQ